MQSLVKEINFIKPKNSNSKKHPEKIEDFNKLRWSRYNNKYIWKKKKPEMRDFFSDIDNFCNQAKKYSKEKKAVAIYIHGVKTTKIAIDLGAGLKRHNLGNKLFGTKKHKTRRMECPKKTVPFNVSTVISSS